MHLMMVPLKNTNNRQQLEFIIESEGAVKEVAWYEVASKGRSFAMDQPQVVGSLKALFGYEDEEWAHIIIKGKDNVVSMAKKLRESCGYAEGQIYALPLMQL